MQVLLLLVLSILPAKVLAAQATGESHANILWLIAGSVIGLLLILADRRWRNKLQHLNVELNKFDAIRNNPSVGLVIFQDSQLLECNASFAHMLGYQISQLVSAQAVNLFASPQSEADFFVQLNRLRSQAGAWELEWPLRQANGQVLWLKFFGHGLNSQQHQTGVVWLVFNINHRKQAEENYQQVLQEQQAIFDNALVGIELVIDRTVIRCNQGWETMLGYQSGELLGKPTRIYYPSDQSWEEHGRIAYPLFSEKRNVITDWQFMRKDGSLIWCSSHSRAIDPEDLSKGTIWVYQDISSHRATEAALQQALLEQQAIFDNAIAGIVIIENQQILRCNHGMEDMLGYMHGQLAGASTRIYFPSEGSWREFLRQSELKLLRGENAELEWEFMRKDGAMIWCTTHGRLLDQQQPQAGAIWVCQDITQRKRTEADLELALLEQQIIFSSIKACIVVVKDRLVQRMNRAMEDLLGIAPGEYIGESTRCYFPSDASYQQFHDRFLATLSNGLTVEGEWEFQRKDGQRVWILFTGKALNTEDLQQGMIFSGLDITERKNNEALLLHTKIELEQGLSEVERTHREVSLLGELSSFLQASQNDNEAYAGIAEFAPRLFPQSVGALYLLDSEKDELEQVLYWDVTSAAGLRSKRSFHSSECWALRRGHQYRQDKPSQVMCCQHIVNDDDTVLPLPYVCLPLVAQGKTFGLLFVEYHQSGVNLETRHRLALSLAEQIGLALANIRLRDALRQQSIRDPLTGLYNRRFMQESLEREMAKARRNQTLLAIAIVDVDHFKKFNDTFGHDAGDQVLREVGQTLQARCRESDVVCRFGGEEFVLILPEINEAIVSNKAQALLQAIRELELSHNQAQLGRITASLGMAIYPVHANGAAQLLDLADQALYQAKHNGRDQFIMAQNKTLEVLLKLPLDQT